MEGRQLVALVGKHVEGETVKIDSRLGLIQGRFLMFNRKWLSVTLVAVLSLVIACASAPPASSGKLNSIADRQVRADVMKMISLWESAAGGSSSPSLVSAEGLSKEGPSYIERWVVNSNGQSVAYSVKLTPSSDGGVDFTIARLPQ
jgi:hypothetical protein